MFLIFLKNLVVNSSQHVNLICTSLLMTIAPSEEEEEEKEEEGEEEEKEEEEEEHSGYC